MAEIVKPLVSVIIPVYNCEKYVAKAIESVLNQSYSNLEILILNDASTDGSDAVIKQYSDERIKYISFTENTKKIGIVNHALSLLSGELVAFQDADDWSDINRIEKQVSLLLSKPKVAICFTGYQINNEKPEEPYRITDELLRQEFHELDFLNYGNYRPTVCATMMFRSDVLIDEPGYHSWFTGKPGEDIHLVYRILKHGKGETIVDTLYHYNYNRLGSFTYNQRVNADSKSLYSLCFLGKVIKYDLAHHVNILDTLTEEELLKLQLESCEEVLHEYCIKNYQQRQAYERSAYYRTGKVLLSPLTYLKKKLK